MAFEFAFIKTGVADGTAVEDTFAAVLVCVDVDTGFVKAIPCPSKQAFEYAVHGRTPLHI